MKRAFAWPVVAALGLGVLLFGGHYLSLVSLHAVVITQVAAIFVLGGWLLVALRSPGWRPQTPLLLPVLIASAAYGLSGLLSQRPRLSLEPTLGGLCFALVFLFLTRLFADPWFRSRVAILVKASVAFVACGYLFQVVLSWMLWWSLIGKVAVPPLRPGWAGLTFGSPNIVAAFLITLSPLAIALLARRRSLRPAFALGAVAMLAVLISGSRSAYLGLAIGAVVTIVGAVGQSRRPSFADLIAGLRRRPALVPLGALVLFGIAILGPSIAYRFTVGGEGVRFDLWASATRIFIEHPITGGGPGSWVQLKTLASSSDVPNLIFNNAHNLYYQTFAELGIVGVIALLILVLAVIRRVTASLRTGSMETRLETLAILFGLCAFATQSFFDTMTRLPSMSLLLVGLAAWVDSSVPADPARSRRFGHLAAGRASSAMGLAALALAIPLVVRVDLGWAHDLAGNQAADQREWMAAVSAFEAARHVDPGFTLYDLQAASAHAHLGQHEQARDLLAAAVRHDPVGLNVIGLAALELSLGHSNEAISLARNAVAIAPGDPTVALNAALIAEAVGETAFAADQFAATLSTKPELAGSQIWSTRPAALTDAVEIAVSRSNPFQGALILAYANRNAEATALLRAQPPSAFTDRYLAVCRWLSGDPRGALDALSRILDVDPLDWIAAAWSARIARLSGYLEEADRYERWAYAVQYDGASPIVLEYSEIPPTRGDRTAGLPGSYPGGVYIRPTSPYLPIPLLTLFGPR